MNLQKRTIIKPGKKRAITKNPFWVDATAMGTQLSKEIYLMRYHHPDEPFQKSYLYNIETGETFEIQIETQRKVLKKCHNCNEWVNVICWPGDTKVATGCDICGVSNYYTINDND